jgi:hypothetical protein
MPLSTFIFSFYFYFKALPSIRFWLFVMSGCNSKASTFHSNIPTLDWLDMQEKDFDKVCLAVLIII